MPRERGRTMSVLIRVDASATIGTGHVMRCLTLAERLRERGSVVRFVCREHEGNLCDLVETHGFDVCRLPRPTNDPVATNACPDYRMWLGVPEDADARQTLDSLHRHSEAVDWLVVDHYALGARWETRFRAFARHIFAIDDIANRAHSCELLLDQNLNDSPEARYRGLVPDSCDLMLGPTYALLRKEFAAAASVPRSRDGRIERILIFFGGTDASGETLKSCRAVAAAAGAHAVVDVIIGRTNDQRDAIVDFCQADPRFEAHLYVTNMAEMMRKADLAIGASGATAWERTFMGLPTLTIAVAQNQIAGAEALGASGAAKYLGTHDEVRARDISAALEELRADPGALLAMERKCAAVHGSTRTPGVDRVIAAMERKHRADT